MKINTKAEFYRLWKANTLGNRTQLWNDPRDAFDSGVPWVGFREVGKAGGGAWVKVPRSDIFRTALDWCDLGRNFIMDDGAPTCYTLQGEVCRTYRGLEGYLCGPTDLPMRRAMAAGLFRSYSGSEVLVLLDRYMDPSSRDDLEALLDLYPDATIEFGCFAVDVGLFPGRNCIFWEVRNY